MARQIGKFFKGKELKVRKLLLIFVINWNQQGHCHNQGHDGDRW